jgi:hypothetical protein
MMEVSRTPAKAASACPKFNARIKSDLRSFLKAANLERFMFSERNLLVGGVLKRTLLIGVVFPRQDRDILNHKAIDLVDALSKKFSKCRVADASQDFGAKSEAGYKLDGRIYDRVLLISAK